MTNKEAIKYLQQLYPNGGHCWLDEQRIEAIGMAINALQEEPVSEKKCMFTKDGYTDEDRKVLCDGCEDCEYSKKEELVSKVWHEPIERPNSNKVVLIIVRCGYIGDSGMPHLAKYDSHNNQYIDKDRTDVCNRPIMYHVDSVEKWVYIDDILNLTTKKEPVSDGLEVAAEECIEELLPETALDAATPFALEYVVELLHKAFKAGAKWQIARLMKDAIDVTVHIDAGGYPYIPQIELYDYDKDVPLAKAGDKYNVILIKEK